MAYFAYRCPITPAPFVEKNIFPPLNYFDSLPKINWQYILKRVENGHKQYTNKYRYTRIHRRTIQNSQKVETVPMSIG